MKGRGCKQDLTGGLWVSPSKAPSTWGRSENGCCPFDLGRDGWAFIPLPCLGLCSPLSPQWAASPSLKGGLGDSSVSITAHPAIPLMLLLLISCFPFTVLSSIHSLFHHFSPFPHFWSLLFLLSIFNPYTPPPPTKPTSVISEIIFPVFFFPPVYWDFSQRSIIVILQIKGR